MVLIDY